MKTKNKKQIIFNKNQEFHENLSASKIAVVSRDYRTNNGNSDFKSTFNEILRYSDKQKCDTVLFSLFTLLDNNNKNIIKSLNKLTNINQVLVEEFIYDKSKKIRDPKEYYVYYKVNNEWLRHSFKQYFGTLKYTKKFEKNTILPFLNEVRISRLFGNFTVFLCGETNIVKYDKNNKIVTDKYKLFSSLNEHTQIILNPIHDKMIRFEMKLKRKFLSQKNRIVISVWNTGKTDKNGTVRDGSKPPWTCYIDGEEIIIKRELISDNLINNRIDIGIINIGKLNTKHNNKYT